MNCPQCGNKLPKGSKFCGVCGATAPEIAEPIPAAAASGGIPPLDVPQPQQPAKKKLPIPVFIAIGAVVLAALAIWGVIALVGGGNSNAYAYLSDGKYTLLKDVNQEPIEISSVKSDELYGRYAYMLDFSPDGKYVYYYTKYDDDSNTATLCRAQYAKLKKGSPKNDKYIEIIANNVSLGFQFVGDDALLYEKSGALYCYDGEENVQIAKDIYHYMVDDNGKILYITQSEDGVKTLYGLTSDDLNDKTKLSSNFAVLYIYSDFGNLLYSKYEDDGYVTLCTGGIGKEETAILQNARHLETYGDKAAFIAENDTTLNLYDYVEDTFAADDAAVPEPNEEDFAIPKYSFEMVTGNDLQESNFEELYTSCTKNLYWYGKSSWWNYSMEGALDLDWGENTEGLRAATQSFIDKFGATADENGFIRVTDEVKAALMEIQKYAAEPENEWQWMWLCYNKHQSGTTTDEEAYSAAREKWYAASNRAALREALKDPENAIPVTTLYFYDGSKLNVVSENVLDTEKFNGAIVFNTADTITEKLPIEDVAYVSDVSKLFEISTDGENYVLLAGGTTCQISEDAAYTYTEACENGDTDLYFTDKEVYLNEEDGTLSMASIEKGKIGDFEILSDDAYVLSMKDNTLYYAASLWSGHCDLYSCSKGTSTCMAKDVVPSTTSLYADGVILTCSGEGNYDGNDLSLINAKGEITVIDDYVTQYIRVDEDNILYIASGDLYLYNGITSMIQSDVQYCWSQNAMEFDDFS